jgi:glycine/D-amino acid oxidase-like deaminating enzyme
MQVSQLPVDPGPAAWNEILDPAPVRPRLDEHCSADWIVIGAGFAGLSAAHRLRELCPEHNIVVLEASRLARGPAGRNSGFMIDVPHDLSSGNYGGAIDADRREIRMNRAGIDYALQLCAQVGACDETISLNGKVNGAITERGIQHNNAYAQQLDNLEESYSRLGAEEMHQLTGTHCYIDGLYTPGTAVIQPALYIRALAAGIESSRVRIHELSAVTQLKRRGTSWQAFTELGSVNAPKVILCVNGHLQSFGFLKRQLIHIFTYASMTRQMTPVEIAALGGRSTWGITPADPLGTTVRRISGVGGDRIIIRNRATFDPSLQVKEGRLKDVASTHDQSFHDRFPMLRKLDMEYRWGGRLCLSRNSVPVFGEIDDGLYSACCQNGLGTVKGTISGKLVAELACGMSSDLLDDMQKFVEPTRLPPEPIASIGATAVLRWGEFRAGKEL